MKLPKIEYPIYDITLPLSKQQIKYRPFLSKEDKLLLMAKESDDPIVIFNNIKQVVNNCILTENINVDDIPIIDIQYLFINLRARSIGEIVEMEYICQNNVMKNGELKKCMHVVPIEIDLLSIHVDVPKDFSFKVELTNTLGVNMKSPSLETSIKLENSNETEVEKAFKSIIDCIEYIYDENGIYYKKDIPPKELSDWLDDLPTKYLAKLGEFFDKYPKMTKDIHFKCPKCGWEEVIKLEGLQDFLE